MIAQVWWRMDRGRCDEDDGIDVNDNDGSSASNVHGGANGVRGGDCFQFIAILDNKSGSLPLLSPW